MRLLSSFWVVQLCTLLERIDLKQISTSKDNYKKCIFNFLLILLFKEAKNGEKVELFK